MEKQILIISTSPRRGGNSDRLADEFARGAHEAGHRVEKINLADCRIAFCRGCLACQRTGQCVIPDDAVEICRRMGQADVIVWATPVYYFCISGQMKTMIDRANALFAADYRFRDVYLLAAAAETGPSVVEGAATAVRGWVSCFERARLAGVVLADGVTKCGDVEGHAALVEAYRMGREVS